jgi:8-oxo-dGTP diphosphatase
MINAILQEINNIHPFDALENQHIQETIHWIGSGSPIFRTQKPDIPPKHLVSYFVLVDHLQQKLLLVDHKMAKLWLPSGGHVEENEHPRITVTRECKEELDTQANFLQEEPLFLTSTFIPEENHTDVSLWYVLNKLESDSMNFDAREFNSIHWFHFNEIPYEKSDPHMQRFVNKLRIFLSKEVEPS